MAKEVVIRIGRDLKSTVEVNGATGPSCTELTEKLIQAVGVATKEDKKDDYYKPDPPRFEWLSGMGG